jgi:FAD-dependent fumarate reductase
MFQRGRIIIVVVISIVVFVSWQEMERNKTVIIVGAGLAGLSCAHQVLQLSSRHNVVILEKLGKAGGNSIKASSGINGAGTRHQKEQDSPEQFFDDTVKSAKGLGKPELMKVLSERSAQAVGWLEQDFGVDLSSVARLGGHSVARTHRGGGKLPPGFAIISALAKPLEDRIWPNCRVLELIRGNNNQVTGVRYTQDSTQHELKGQVVLASGGFSGSKEMLQRYRPDIAHLPTTNGPQTQGEGQQMCGSIDAQLREMDQVQIHPTGFVDPADPSNSTKFLAGEALRGEGGVLLDAQGKRFVDELQTRDVVSRAIMERDGDPTLVLDQRAYSRIHHHVDFYVMKGLMRSGTLDELKAQFGWTADPEVPASEKYYWGTVTPVVHFTMGGVETTAHGQVVDKTGHVIPNLYAAGEVTGGVHGANRLGGSSLLECVVFGRIIAESIVNS